jgi:hypothetical protein
MAPRLIARSIRFSSSQVGSAGARKGAGDRSRPGENHRKSLEASASTWIAATLLGSRAQVRDRLAVEQSAEASDPRRRSWLISQGAGEARSDRTSVRERGPQPATPDGRPDAQPEGV